MIPADKSSMERLVKIFKQSREHWKLRAIEKQNKLRALQIRIRDLEKSRERWKPRAQTAEKILRGYRTAEKMGAMQSSIVSASTVRYGTITMVFLLSS